MVVKIEKLDNFGRGITYIDGKICFVSCALPLEEVDINITKSTNKYLEAEVVDYINKSSDRCSNTCEYLDCGGCCLRHMSFSCENRFKEEKVKDIMKRFAGIDSNIINDIVFSFEDNYRNKIVLHGSNGVLGLYKENSNEIVSIDRCLLVNDKINDVIRIINDINIDIESCLIKTSNDLEHVLVSIKGKVGDISKLKDVCDVLIINDKVISSSNYILTNIGSKKYYQSSDSFFQINTTLTKNLYDFVYDNLKDFKDITLLDLYCGTGTIGIYVSDICSKIIGIDYNKSNIEDANRNKKLNNLDNISFICDKVENRIDSFKDINVVIVDPPRSGLDSKTRKYLIDILPERIIYVSCDPVTLARDLKELSLSYEICSITPFNMFPRTYHVECVCILNLK